MTYHPGFKQALETEMTRARFDLQLKAGACTRFSTMQRRIRMPDGRTMEGFDLFVVDIDKDGRECSRPVLLNDVPIPFVQEAAEFADSVARGRRFFTWRGARAEIIGDRPQMPPRTVELTERASPRLLRRSA